MTPATTHLTFLNLRVKFVPAKTAPDEIANGIQLFAAHVIKLKQNWVCLSAINAWMLM
jgi:hypothetical protein